MTEPSEKNRPPTPSIGRRLNRFARPIGRRLAPIFAIPALKMLSSSWHTEVLGASHRDTALDADGCLYALWHGRMLMGISSENTNRMSVLVSPSRDGSLMDPILHAFSYDTVRGSTSRGGARALRELLGRLQDGGRIIITPDGPRGPRHGMNEGLAWMARATGFPVLPLGFACDRVWHMSSWDKFTIPKWGANIVSSYGEPLWLAKDSSREERASFTDRVRSALIAEEKRAFKALGVEPDFEANLV